MIRRLILAASLATLGGCAVDPMEIGREPAMTPVGAGLTPTLAPIPTQPPKQARYAPGGSLWQDSSADLFQDRRATKVGDVVTVKISISDKASMDNSSDRSRDSKLGLQFDGEYDLQYGKKPIQGTGTIDGSATRTTETKGKGAIERSESIELLIAAVVSDVLPNGNLVISGSQEVRVNYEVRVLNVAGIVRPRDISPDSAVSYDKIAEARISYGGRGRIMEVQQPSYGQQIFDILSPL